MRDVSNPAGTPSVTAIVTSWPAAAAVRACARMTELPPPMLRLGMRNAIFKVLKCAARCPPVVGPSCSKALLQHSTDRLKARTSGERNQPCACIPRDRRFDARAKSPRCRSRASIWINYLSYQTVGSAPAFHPQQLGPGGGRRHAPNRSRATRLWFEHPEQSPFVISYGWEYRE